MSDILKRWMSGKGWPGDKRTTEPEKEPADAEKG